MAKKLVGQNISPPDLYAKITGRAKYAEDFRADGMVFAKKIIYSYTSRDSSVFSY